MGPATATSRRKWMEESSPPSNHPIFATTTTTTSSSEVVYDDNDNDSCGSEPVSVACEPALYHIPKTLHAEFRPLPRATQVGVWIVATWLSALWTFSQWRLAWIRPLLALQQQQQSAVASLPSLGKLVNWAIKAVVMALAFTMVLQDFLLSTSRISTRQLIQQFFLPSTFSRYEPVTLPSSVEASDHDNNQQQRLDGVHYLLCEADPASHDNSNSSNNNETNSGHRGRDNGLIYVNHGFGASSLSWLPALQPMLKRLTGYRAVLGHDAPGFGFTERPPEPEGMEAYTSRGSSEIGYQLLLKALKKNNKSHASQEDGNNDNQQHVLLMGHSMGAITTLRMALLLHRRRHEHGIEKQHVVLVDPALGIRPNQDKKTRPNNNNNRRRRRNVFQRVLLPDRVTSYVLRRAVGQPGFWRSGLKMVAWGDPTRVTEADVLRFQWPAIGQGWERGLLAFARAQFEPLEMTDKELLQNVLSLPNTTVSVIYGAKDKVVRPSAIRAFFKPFPNVELKELDGLGHDPFEEDVDAFLQALKTVLASQEKQRKR